MRPTFLFFISEIAALSLVPVPSLSVGVGFVLDQTHGVASIAARDGMICNVAMIPGDEAYREYMRNVTTGPWHNGVAIDYPTYKSTQQTEFGNYTPLETMLRELSRATSEQVYRRLREQWHTGVSISLPLAFADPDYEERFELDFLHSLLSLRAIDYQRGESGATALAVRGGICLAETHPLLPATTTANPPLQRFAASAAISLSRLDNQVALKRFGSYNVHFGCSLDPELLRSWEMAKWASDETESDEQLTIDSE
ncbi:hypothetical protein VHEMI00836 [[Torrubiella] hemipterigena]|uniref:Uncharacterized protein n=1 Tax=[Torrubiella] hemipterigena TaxID=1531966 RepID=A0A0A1T3N3_9HYPO|nr:hypothetical protein VHEMI00836 [[Torrubiella] hemipterigena]